MFLPWVGQKIVLAAHTVKLKVEWRSQWAVEKSAETFFDICIENTDGHLTCRVDIYDDMLSLQVMTITFEGQIFLHRLRV